MILSYDPLLHSFFFLVLTSSPILLHGYHLFHENIHIYGERESLRGDEIEKRERERSLLLGDGIDSIYDPRNIP